MARGVIVCDEWKNNYSSFKKWALENGYNETLTIDRINVNGNYEPNNCRWATSKEQSRNRTDNFYITYQGNKYILTDFAREHNINTKTLKRRLQKGWTIDDAINIPVPKVTKKVLCIENNTIFNTVQSAAIFAKIPNTNISRACRRGIKAGGYHWKYI